MSIVQDYGPKVGFDRPGLRFKNWYYDVIEEYGKFTHSTQGSIILQILKKTRL